MHVKSPIIIAGLYAEGNTTVVESVKSRDHTELMMNYFGADIKENGLNVISHAVENLYSQHVIIPGDISIAAYFIAAGLFSSTPKYAFFTPRAFIIILVPIRICSVDSSITL